MSQLLNETFQRHLKKLHKDLLIEIEDPNVNKNVDVSTDVLSPEIKNEFWNDFQSSTVKDFVDKYGSKIKDAKFHAFITAGVADGINDENFKVDKFYPKASDLLPTQNEIGFGNSINDLIMPAGWGTERQLTELKKILEGNHVMLSAGSEGELIPVVVFQDKYIIDGHHRWSKIACGNADATIDCLNFHSPNLKSVEMALKSFHLAIAAIVKSFPVVKKSGENLMNSNKQTVYSYVTKNIQPEFAQIYNTGKSLPDNNAIANYISDNAATTVIGKKGAADGGNLPRSHMPQTDQAPGYEDSLKKGEINFLRDKVTEKMVNETFQRHIKLLHKKLNLNESIDINQVASTLQFKPVTKQKLVYKYVENGKPGSMSPMTYTKSTVQQPVVTTTTDGKETQNTADVGDIIMSGATGENYVVKAAKLPKLYTGNVGSDIYPEQSPRQVALYSGEPVTFKAPWGEDMVIKPGDYLVKDPANTGYYRIAKVEFEKTYNKL